MKDSKYEHQRFQYKYSKTSGVVEDIYVSYMENLIEPSNRELYECVKTSQLDNKIGNVEAGKSGEATGWNVSIEQQAFYLLTKGVQTIVSDLLYSLTDGQQPDIPAAYYPMNSWGVIYQKGGQALVHNHFPALWSSVYYIKAESKDSPLCFPDFDCGIPPESGYVVNFPAYMWHYVPELKEHEDRAVFAVNWLYWYATLRDCMWNSAQWHNERQVRGNMPPSPWLEKTEMKTREHTSITHIPTLHEGAYANRSKRPHREA